LDRHFDERLGRGRPYLPKAEAIEDLALSPSAFNAAASRLAPKGRVARLEKGFFLILRPEDRGTGGPDPARWIDPLMHDLGIDYRSRSSAPPPFTVHHTRPRRCSR